MKVNRTGAWKHGWLDWWNCCVFFFFFFKFLDVNFSKPPAGNDPTHAAPFQPWLQEGLYQCFLHSFKKSNSDPFIFIHTVWRWLVHTQHTQRNWYYTIQQVLMLSSKPLMLYGNLSAKAWHLKSLLVDYQVLPNNALTNFSPVFLFCLFRLSNLKKDLQQCKRIQ